VSSGADETLIQVWAPTRLVEAAKRVAAEEGLSFSRWLRELLQEATTRIAA
jgi:predicted DNA binding CopG/RHH family protein